MLTSEQVREATESDGLNVLVMHYGCRDWDYSVDEAAMIHAMLPQAFIACHRGYRLKELLQEVYGAQELALLLNAGFLLRTDYAQHSGQSHPQVNPDRRAYLCGIARAEATGRRGTLAATVLLPSTRSRFGFADYERDFLRHAIDGATDLELARTLLLSTSTVKKRWERIYQRVEDVDSTLLPIDTPHSAEKRGIEKRRRLLAYLRTHLEEFVP
ncbi:MAG TPA: hypothetical protein VGX75_08430 [bacterium]|nr:hypothetical protein [bacterium]